MTLPDIRLSPSGTPLGELPGGPFTGLQLRLDEDVSTLAAAAITTVALPLERTDLTSVQVSLPTPSPERRYGVRCHFGIETISATTATFSATLQGSYGEDVWFNLGGNSVATNADNEHVTVTVDFPMTLGSGLPTPMPVDEDDRPEFSVRVLISASGNSLFTVPAVTGFGGRALLSLAEYV
jgi:hypothetical protein